MPPPPRLGPVQILGGLQPAKTGRALKSKVENAGAAERTSWQMKTAPKDFRPPKDKAGREEIQLILSVGFEHHYSPNCLRGRDTPFLYFREGPVMPGNLKKQSRLGLKMHHSFSIGK